MQHRGRAVEREPALVQHRHRDALAVLGGRAEQTRDVGRGVETARNRLRLDQRPPPLGDVVVVGLLRAVHRRNAESDRSRVELEHRLEFESVSLLLERDVVRLAAAQVVDDKARAAVLAHQQHEPVLEQRRLGDQAPVAMGDAVAPVGFLRRLAGRDNDLEVARSRIGADVKAIAVVHDLVANARPSRRDHPRRRGRRVEIDDPRLRSVMAVHGDHRRAAEPGRLDPDEPRGVVLAENLGVFALRGSEPMQPHPTRSMVLVLLDVEKRLRIARPHDVAGRAADTVGEVLPALHVSDGDDMHFRTETVGTPGEPGVVGRMTGGGELEVRLSPSARVAIDQHRLLAARARPPAIDAMLPAAAKSRIVGPGTVDLRRLAVVLLEPRAHLADQLRLQRQRRSEQRVGVSVFRLQQRADVFRQQARIAQDLAPVRGPYPGIVVGPGEAVGAQLRRARLGARRRRRGRGWSRIGKGLRRGISHKASCWGDSPKRSVARTPGTSNGAAHNAAAPASRSSFSPP